MNKGTVVLVGCVVGAGVLFYTSSGSRAARPTVTATATAATTHEVAHSGKTPKPASFASPTPAPTQVNRITLAQARALPRPFIPVASSGGGTGLGPPAQAPSEWPASPVDTLPTATPTPPPGGPPSEVDPPIQTTTATPALPTPPVDWWAIPTPPPLPPIPDGSLSPHPPSE